MLYYAFSREDAALFAASDEACAAYAALVSAEAAERGERQDGQQQDGETATDG